jgi:ABC-type transport system involved in cytochrome bd biosynthesis fused ATPase/permease subunit
MGEFSPIHFLIALLLLLATIIGVPWLAYRHGRKVGDQQGYIRGYKQGQGLKS